MVFEKPQETSVCGFLKRHKKLRQLKLSLLRRLLELFKFQQTRCRAMAEQIEYTHTAFDLKKRISS